VHKLVGGSRRTRRRGGGGFCTVKKNGAVCRVPHHTAEKKRFNTQDTTGEKKGGKRGKCYWPRQKRATQVVDLKSEKLPNEVDCSLERTQKEREVLLKPGNFLPKRSQDLCKRKAAMRRRVGESGLTKAATEASRKRKA